MVDGLVTYQLFIPEVVYIGDPTASISLILKSSTNSKTAVSLKSLQATWVEIYEYQEPGREPTYHEHVMARTMRLGDMLPTSTSSNGETVHKLEVPSMDASPDCDHRAVASFVHPLLRAFGGAAKVTHEVRIKVEYKKGGALSVFVDGIMARVPFACVVHNASGAVMGRRRGNNGARASAGSASAAGSVAGGSTSGGSGSRNNNAANRMSIMSTGSSVFSETMPWDRGGGGGGGGGSSRGSVLYGSAQHASGAASRYSPSVTSSQDLDERLSLMSMDGGDNRSQRGRPRMSSEAPRPHKTLERMRSPVGQQQQQQQQQQPQQQIQQQALKSVSAFDHKAMAEDHPPVPGYYAEPGVPPSANIRTMSGGLVKNADDENDAFNMPDVDQPVPRYTTISSQITAVGSESSSNTLGRGGNVGLPSRGDTQVPRYSTVSSRAGSDAVGRGDTLVDRSEMPPPFTEFGHVVDGHDDLETLPRFTTFAPAYQPQQPQQQQPPVPQPVPPARSSATSNLSQLHINTAASFPASTGGNFGSGSGSEQAMAMPRSTSFQARLRMLQEQSPQASPSSSPTLGGGVWPVINSNTGNGNVNASPPRNNGILGPLQQHQQQQAPMSPNIALVAKPTAPPRSTSVAAAQQLAARGAIAPPVSLASSMPTPVSSPPPLQVQPPLQPPVQAQAQASQPVDQVQPVDYLSGLQKKAMAAYEPMFHDEMRVQVGDMLCVKNAWSNGFAQGVNLTTGREGIFPQICLFGLTASPEPQSISSSTTVTPSSSIHNSTTSTSTPTPINPFADDQPPLQLLNNGSIPASALPRRSTTKDGVPLALPRNPSWKPEEVDVELEGGSDEVLTGSVGGESFGAGGLTGVHLGVDNVNINNSNNGNGNNYNGNGGGGNSSSSSILGTQNGPKTSWKSWRHAMHPYLPMDPDELLVNAGDLILFSEAEIFPDRWCPGFNTKTGRKGFFPIIVFGPEFGGPPIAQTVSTAIPFQG
ncbi:hypothetical protein HDU76_002354 [Blyttiomyces sp. JEL0837]|nr:hypothetical protein HDU76_002354 [Blyttiomyces sp. JEL0837]